MLEPNQCTFYSGGHRGTEAFFGAQAEQWGLKEVNFSFEGHQPARHRGLVVLGSEELKKGDISMEIVSLRMNRTYASAEKIRKVIQTLFHMVNKGFQVFAVGWILPDGTVKGGTGWGVELAKLFNRPLSVFDQDRDGWFTWDGKAWIADEPSISADSFTGTGTRDLGENGRQAIEALFKRSFTSRA